MQLNRTQWLALAGAAVLIVVLVLAPIKPEIKGGVFTKADLKIQQAVGLVQKGENPMQGITMLREVLKEDANNIQALFHLGVFSIQSGQYEKALERFSHILKIDSTFADAYFYSGLVYKTVGEKEKALTSFEEYKAQGAQEHLTEAEEYIIGLKNI